LNSSRLQGSSREREQQFAVFRIGSRRRTDIIFCINEGDFQMSLPDNDEPILPPRTGEYDLSQLLQYPNARVRVLARLLNTTFGWTIRDSFTGEYISHLCNYIDRNSDGTYDFRRIQPTEHSSLFLATLHYNNGTGPAPHRIVYIETRRSLARRAEPGQMRVDGTYLVGFERIPLDGGRTCFSNGRRDHRGRWHFTPSTCHTW
jgi:hypothetical protein